MVKCKFYFIIIPFIMQSCHLFMEHPVPKVTQMENLTMINNSDSSVCYLFSNQNPDTSLFVGFSFSDTAKWTINKKSQVTLNSEEYVVNDFNGKAPSNYQYLFLFSRKVIETKPWDSVRSKYLILKRYDLTVDYLQKNNWTITYP